MCILSPHRRCFAGFAEQVFCRNKRSIVTLALRTATMQSTASICSGSHRSKGSCQCSPGKSGTCLQIFPSSNAFPCPTAELWSGQRTGIYKKQNRDKKWDALSVLARSGSNIGSKYIFFASRRRKHRNQIRMSSSKASQTKKQAGKSCILGPGTMALIAWVTPRL